MTETEAVQHLMLAVVLQFFVIHVRTSKLYLALHPE